MKTGEQIRMNTLASGPDFVYEIGAVLTVGEHIDVETAELWIANRSAEKYQAPVEEPAPGKEPDPEPKRDDAEFEKKVRRMKKADLLALCASEEFEIDPPDDATNKELVELILAKKASDQDPPGDE